MGLPAGNFSSQHSGRLLITFGGRWLVEGSSSWMYLHGDWELRLVGYVGGGTNRRVCPLSINANSAILEYDYPGGNVAVPVGMEEAGHSFGGAGSVSATDLMVRCRLMKK